MMKKNENYEKGKQIVNETTNEFNEIYKYYKNYVADYEDEVMPMDEKHAEEYEIGKKFCMLMEILNELSPNERNLILLHFKMKIPAKTLEVFNGIGGDLKNKATLSSMITIIKKKIKDKAKDKENKL